MKKFLTVLVMGVLAISLTGCKKNDVNTIAKIKERGKLVLLTNATFPPFEYASSNSDSVNGVSGVDVEFGKVLAAKLGVELVVEDMAFDNLTIALQAGKGDIIAAGMSENPERAKVVDFSNEYFNNKLLIIVPKNSDIKSVDDLKGKKVSVQQGTTGNDYVDSLEGVTAMMFPGMLEAGVAVANGDADASIMDVLTAKIIVGKNPSLTLIEDSVQDEKTSIATQKGNDELMKLVNETILELQQNGKLQEWFDFHSAALLEG